MTAVLRVVGGAVNDWPPRRRRRLTRDIRTALLLTRAALDLYGIDEAARVLSDHWEHITVAYPADWVEVARDEGAL